MKETIVKVLTDNCLTALDEEYFKKQGITKKVCLSFLDPPFNQGKDYKFFDDAIPGEHYWDFMRDVCVKVNNITTDGGAIYFMQREKNTEEVLQCLRETGWTFQNLIVWTKKTSAVPSTIRYGKQYQIIAYATKGKRPRVFNRLRIDPPIRPEHKYERENGLFVTDIWDDIRELTSGYFAGDEAIRIENGERAHKQQSPKALLLRIILSSTLPGDLVLDPFAGTGTTLVTAKQLYRDSIGIEIDPSNSKLIMDRVNHIRKADMIGKLREYYKFTVSLDKIWPS